MDFPDFVPWTASERFQMLWLAKHETLQFRARFPDKIVYKVVASRFRYESHHLIKHVY
jgi:hypothetical protein